MKTVTLCKTRSHKNAIMIVRVMTRKLFKDSSDEYAFVTSGDMNYFVEAVVRDGFEEAVTYYAMGILDYLELP